jgi:S-adenosylmethionine:tRNA ribosyltransferase-isomerase
VGLDTFAPVTEDDPAEHKIHTEWCELPQTTANAINETRAAGGRVVAVGTTSVRTFAPGFFILMPVRSPAEFDENVSLILSLLSCLLVIGPGAR